MEAPDAKGDGKDGASPAIALDRSLAVAQGETRLTEVWVIEPTPADQSGTR